MAKKKKKKYSFDLVSCIMFMVIITVVACVSNFSAALQEPLGSALVSMNIISTGLVLILWFSQAFMAGRAKSKGFLVLLLVWWGGGIALFKLVDIAMSVGSDILYYIGFYGLLLIMVPTYALIPLCVVILKVDYFVCYPLILIALLGVYLLGWKMREKADSKAAGLEAFAQDPSAKGTSKAAPQDSDAVPEAALAAAEAIRAATALEQAARAAEQPAEPDSAAPQDQP